MDRSPKAIIDVTNLPTITRAVAAAPKPIPIIAGVFRAPSSCLLWSRSSSPGVLELFVGSFVVLTGFPGVLLTRPVRVVSLELETTGDGVDVDDEFDVFEDVVENVTELDEVSLETLGSVDGMVTEDDDDDVGGIDAVGKLIEADDSKLDIDVKCMCSE